LPQTFQQSGSRNQGPAPARLRSVLAELSAGGTTLPPERELVNTLGVPRSRLRRVLAEMREAGHLPPAQVGRRTTRESSVQTEGLARLANPTDVIELRLILEPQFARLAAVRASSLEITRITRAAQSSPDEDYGTPDLTFHSEIANASRNALGRELYNILRQVGADARVRLPARRRMCSERRKIRDAEHMRIARAIADRDPELAEECMRAHLASVQAVIMERISPDPADLSDQVAAAGGV
jgi:GntR family transcriptional repressor for pyruvate dehydrogenase complex